MHDPRHASLTQAFAALHRSDFPGALRHAQPWHLRAPNDVEAAMLFGLAAAGTGDAAGAATALATVARLRPDAAHPASDLIALLATGQHHDRLRETLDAAIAHDPDDHRLLTAAGAYLQQIGEFDQSRTLLTRALSLCPGYQPARNALAATLAETGALDEATGLLAEMIANGAGGAAASCNLGVMLGVLNQHDEAEVAFARARSLEPHDRQIAFNHGMARLKSGRLAQGWSAFNMRLLLPGHSVLPMESLLPKLGPSTRLDHRTVLITHDSGFGDTLQFIRYAELLAARGARVLLWVPSPLHRLLARMQAIAGVCSDRDPWPRYDWHCPVMRLPEIFATTLDSIPATIPYLHADPELIAQWGARLPPRTRRRSMGLVWAGSARESQPVLQAIDRRRSIDPALLRPLFDIPDIDWISLQLGRQRPDLALHDPMGAVQDFSDTAAIIAHLDAVVSVDTAVAHLAAGLGKPVLMLDRFDNCWRWLSGRSDSPWYPTLRIFRQQQWGDWTDPVRRLAAFVGAQ